MLKRIVVLLITMVLSAYALACEVSIAPNAEYKSAPDRAVVLVAFKGDKPFIWLGPSGVETKWTLSGEKDAVYAIPANVDTRFSVSTLGVTGAFATVDKAHTIKIERPGIYYYGTIYSEKLRVTVTEDQLEKHLALAKKNFASVFEVLEPVNFK